MFILYFKVVEFKFKELFKKNFNCNIAMPKLGFIFYAYIKPLDKLGKEITITKKNNTKHYYR